MLSRFAVHLASIKVQQATVERLFKANNDFVDKSRCNTGSQKPRNSSMFVKTSSIAISSRRSNSTNALSMPPRRKGRVITVTAVMAAKGTMTTTSTSEFEEIVLDAGQAQHFQTEPWQFC